MFDSESLPRVWRDIYYKGKAFVEFACLNVRSFPMNDRSTRKRNTVRTKDIEKTRRISVKRIVYVRWIQVNEFYTLVLVQSTPVKTRNVAIEGVNADCPDKRNFEIPSRFSCSASKFDKEPLVESPPVSLPFSWTPCSARGACFCL